MAVATPTHPHTAPQFMVSEAPCFEASVRPAHPPQKKKHTPSLVCAETRGSLSFLGNRWVVKASAHPMSCPATHGSHSATQFLRRPVCGYMWTHILNRIHMGQPKGSHTMRPPALLFTPLQRSLCARYSHVLLSPTRNRPQPPVPLQRQNRYEITNETTHRSLLCTHAQTSEQ